MGGRLAVDLADEGHDVVVIEKRPDAIDLLGKSFNGVSIAGEAYDVDVLAEAGLERADAFCAMTDDDNTNLMAVEVAKAVYEVPRVLARLQDPAREESYRALDIPYISTTNLITSVAMETILSSDFAVHVPFSTGEIDVVEFELSPAAGGSSVTDLEIEGELRVAAIRRDGRTLIPTDHTELRGGDLVVAAAHREIRPKIEQFIENERQ